VLPKVALLVRVPSGKAPDVLESDDWTLGSNAGLTEIVGGALFRSYLRDTRDFASFC